METFCRILAFGALALAGFSFGGIQAGAQTDLERLAMIDSLSNPMTAAGSEVMRFENVRIEAGEMNEDSEPSEYVFRWTNEGSSPLSVTWVQTTCGCASPSFERLPVKPGESASLKVTYHPKGHPGGFVRRIFVYTNLSESKPTAVLELAGRVTPSVLPTDDYPVAMGGLLLKRRTVSFDGGSRQTERIECLNAGDKPLKVSADAKALPAGIKVEPLSIAPGETADLVLRFYPAAAENTASGGFTAPKLPASVPVFLKGIDLPPTKCMITINFK